MVKKEQKRSLWMLPNDKTWLTNLSLNNRFLRERGMEYQVFLCIFQKNSAMATLGLEEMGKFLWEGSHTKVPLENAKKYGIMKSGLDTMPLFLLDNLLKSRRFKKQVWVCSHFQTKSRGIPIVDSNFHTKKLWRDKIAH